MKASTRRDRQPLSDGGSWRGITPVSPRRHSVTATRIERWASATIRRGFRLEGRVHRHAKLTLQYDHAMLILEPNEVTRPLAVSGSRSATIRTGVSPSSTRVSTCPTGVSTGGSRSIRRRSSRTSGLARCWPTLLNARGDRHGSVEKGAAPAWSSVASSRWVEIPRTRSAAEQPRPAPPRCSSSCWTGRREDSYAPLNSPRVTPLSVNERDFSIWERTSGVAGWALPRSATASDVSGLQIKDNRHEKSLPGLKPGAVD